LRQDVIEKNSKMKGIMEIITNEAVLSNMSIINIILGRNGAGKSRFLRAIDENYSQRNDWNVRYISPERAGIFRRDANVQNNMEGDERWLRLVRAKNQAENFKAASANLLRELELAYLRRLENSSELRADPERTFRLDRLERINRLLANITIAQEGSDLVFRSADGEKVPPDKISSGESEAVALASEIMYFFETADPGRFNLLLLDEPDVHLHPDLQARLARLLIAAVTDMPTEIQSRVAICIATHSTPLVCELATSAFTTIGTKQFGRIDVEQVSTTDSLKKWAPFFGHPLSQSLSNDILLIVEGEDDERVWQQAGRSSQGRIRLFPIVAGSVDQQAGLENTCASLLAALYDEPIAYSIRDGDGVGEALEAVGPVKRFRLQCYAVENLLVTDECLAVVGTSWPDFQQAIERWLKSNMEHRDKELILQLQTSNDRLRNTNIKAIRQVICEISGSKKPWEVVVGQAIGNLLVPPLETNGATLFEFIGQDACLSLLPSGE
jgi:hypothetical protein